MSGGRPNIAALVSELSRFGTEHRRRIASAARAARQQHIVEALRRVRTGLLAEYSDTAASYEIDDAVHQRRSARGHNRAVNWPLRVEIRRQLLQELDQLDDVPGAHRIRQLVKK